MLFRRWADWSLIGIAFLGLALNVMPWALVATAPEFDLGSLLHDDGFYYLVIAENILDGRGATFDGINPTSGFQPLYQGVTIVLVAASRATGISVFRWIFFANLLLVGLAMIPLIRLLTDGKGRSALTAGAVFAAIALPLNFALVFKRLGTGMEMALALLLLSLWARAMVGLRTSSQRPGEHIGNGLLLGALTLTRIDYALFAVIFAGYAIALGGRRSIRQLALVGLGYLILVGAYAGMASIYLESIIPVSFLAKQYYVSVQVAGMTLLDRIRLTASNLALIWLYPLGYSVFGYFWRWGNAGLGVVAAAFVAWAGIAIACLRDRLPRLDWRAPWLWLMGAVALHSAAVAWSGVGFVGPGYFWYYTPELVATVLGLGWLFVQFFELPRSIRWVSVVPILLWVGSTWLYKLDEDIATYLPYRAAIEQVRDLTPPDTVLGSWDAGYNAYWLRPRTVINLDGMVNSRRFLDTVIKANRHAEYIQEARIAFIFNMVKNTPDALTRVRENFFHDPSIPRSCYDIDLEAPFERQNLVIFLLKYTCLRP